MDVNRWIITGWRGSGKTSFCKALIDHARQENWDAAGILSPGEFQEGSKNAIDAVNIRTHEIRPLAAMQRQSESDLALSVWFFNQQTLAWGNQALRDSLPCDMLVMDELGPLEFKHHQGWMAAFDVLASGRFRLALIVIRPELVPEAEPIFHPTKTIWINTVSEIDAQINACKPLLADMRKSP